MSTLSHRVLQLTCLLVALSLPAQAQFSQYRAPGTFEPERETVEERLEQAMREARWSLGRWLLEPWAGIRNLSHQDNLGAAAGAEVSDLSMTVGAGLRFYRPVGGDMTVAAHVLPEYVWWQDLTERRRFSGRYGAGLFGNFGRIGIEVSGQQLDEARIFSREVEEPVNTTDRIGRAALEVELGRSLAVFSATEFRRLEYRSEEGDALPEVSVLDREEVVSRIGVRYGLAGALTVGVGFETSETEFVRVEGRADLSNSGDAPFLNLGLERERLHLALDLASRELSAVRGGDFVTFSESTGQATASIRLSAPLELQLFGDRDLVYSLSSDYAYFQDSRTGVALQASLSRSVGIRAFLEEGDNEYVVTAPGVAERKDDLSSWGVSLSFALGRSRLTVGTRTTEYTSNLPQFDRDFRQIVSSLSVGSGGSSPWG